MEELQKSMNGNSDLLEVSKSLIERIRLIKQEAQKRKKQYRGEKLNRPIGFWIKKDRLVNEVGKEFTIILRTKGCSWALS